MKHKRSTKAPLVRLALGTAALFITVSVGGFIDVLATSFGVAADLLYGPVQTTETKS